MKKFFFIILLSIPLYSQHQTPLNIAHRGASSAAPENTISAFLLAIEQHADALEIDVRMTKDSHLVVLHDASVKRTTNGNGNVENLTLAEIQSLDAGSWFSEEFTNEKISTLAEVLSILDSTTLIIEIKSNEIGIEEKVIQEIFSAHKQYQTILKSFYPDVIRRLKELAPEIPRIYVFALHWTFFNFTFGTVPRFENIFKIPADYLQIHRLAISQSFVEKSHSHSYKIIAWGVNSENAMKEMISLGVDGIETDFPELLHNLYQR